MPNYPWWIFWRFGYTHSPFKVASARHNSAQNILHVHCNHVSISAAASPSQVWNRGLGLSRSMFLDNGSLSKVNGCSSHLKWCSESFGNWFVVIEFVLLQEFRWLFHIPKWTFGSKSDWKGKPQSTSFRRLESCLWYPWWQYVARIGYCWSEERLLILVSCQRRDIKCSKWIQECSQTLKAVYLFTESKYWLLYFSSSLRIVSAAGLFCYVLA